MGVEAINGIKDRKFAKAGYERKIQAIKRVNRVCNEKFKKTVENEIKRIIPKVNIHIGNIPYGNKALKCFALGCVAQGNIKNISVEQCVLDKMENNKEFKYRVFNNLTKQFNEFVPSAGDIKVLAQGTIINEDGSVDGWILGSPNILYVNLLT
ncbi:hypothetical protein [Vallitalea guaymasensis]|uniref:hypothetical protein n=1 Tax=Vallitalea guaymasensis TaxID=1185412 RepID=UPI0023562707|nr:hypothetical protein [Vallitalea guaymasensis]